MPDAYSSASLLERYATIWVKPMRNTCLGDPKIYILQRVPLDSGIGSNIERGTALGDVVLAMVPAASCPPHSYLFYICGNYQILFQKISFSHTPLVFFSLKSARINFCCVKCVI